MNNTTMHNRNMAGLRFKEFPNQAKLLLRRVEWFFAVTIDL